MREYPCLVYFYTESTVADKSYEEFLAERIAEFTEFNRNPYSYGLSDGKWADPDTEEGRAKILKRSERDAMRDFEQRKLPRIEQTGKRFPDEDLSHIEKLPGFLRWATEENEKEEEYIPFFDDSDEEDED